MELSRLVTCRDQENGIGFPTMSPERILRSASLKPFYRGVPKSERRTAPDGDAREPERGRLGRRGPFPEGLLSRSSRASCPGFDDEGETKRVLRSVRGSHGERGSRTALASAASGTSVFSPVKQRGSALSCETLVRVTWPDGVTAWHSACSGGPRSASPPRREDSRPDRRGVSLLENIYVRVSNLTQGEGPSGEAVRGGVGDGRRSRSCAHPARPSEKSPSESNRFFAFY